MFEIGQILAGVLVQYADIAIAILWVIFIIMLDR